MLQGIKKNLNDNYYFKMKKTHKESIKTKNDVSITEAFELYMLKKFYKLELNSLSSKILSYWEKDFNFSIDKHKDFLSQNFENQEKYSSKFSEILENMDVFSSENDENKEEDNEKNDAQENNSQNNENDQSESKSDSKGNETQSILESSPSKMISIYFPCRTLCIPSKPRSLSELAITLPWGSNTSFFRVI